MKLRKIKIENFRGIPKLEMDLDDLIVLIGENNTGKTAILHALKLCLRDFGPRRGVVFDPFDFHLKNEISEPNNADPISVTVTFGEATANEWDKARQTRFRDVVQVDPSSDLSFITFYITCFYNVDTCDFEQNWDFLNSQGKPLPKKNGVLGAFQNEIVFYMLDALRDAGRNFDAKGPFWRPFLKDSQLSDEKKEEIETKLSELNELIVSSHDTFETVRERLKNLQDIVPMQPGDIVSIEAVPGGTFDMLAKAQVHLGTTTGAKVPVGRHGEGTQSLAVLMLFASFLDLNANGSNKSRAPLVALEEPEAHLHPSAVRTLWKTIEMIPGQKLISTHSGDLLSQVPINVVRRLARTACGVESFRLEPGTLDVKEQRMFEFHIRRARGELLFARCWLLGEGETEVTLFHEIAQHLGIDLERAGVRCIPYRLGASIELFLKVAKDFGIRCCILTDNDGQGRKDRKYAEQYTESSLSSQSIHAMPENDIEHYLCTHGFGDIYKKIYDTSPQLQALAPVVSPCSSCGKTPPSPPCISASPEDVEYWPQLLKVIKNKLNKPEAVLSVVREIQGGKPVPNLLETVIKDAVALAKGV